MGCFGEPQCAGLHGNRITFDHNGGRYDRSFYGSENGSIHFGAVKAWRLKATVIRDGQTPYGTEQGWMQGEQNASYQNTFTFFCDRDPSSVYQLKPKLYGTSPTTGASYYTYSVLRTSSQCSGTTQIFLSGYGTSCDYSCEYVVAVDAAIGLWRSPDNALILDTTQYRGVRNLWASCIPCPEGQEWSNGCCCEPCTESSLRPADNILSYLVKING